MTPAEFKAIRKARGETRIAFARSLGYTGTDSTVDRLMRRIERGEKGIAPATALKVIGLKYRKRKPCA